jgi:hypothetical protein
MNNTTVASIAGLQIKSYNDRMDVMKNTDVKPPGNNGESGASYAG